MVADGEAAHLVLDTRQELKSLAVFRDRQLFVPVQQRPRPVMIILDHTDDRDARDAQ